jgi:hypothetical protein
MSFDMGSLYKQGHKRFNLKIRFKFTNKLKIIYNPHNVKEIERYRNEIRIWRNFV